MNPKRVLKNLIVAIGLGCCFFWGTKTIASQKKVPRSRPKVESVLEVETVSLSLERRPLQIMSHGTVIPHQSSSLRFQVPGKIVELSPKAQVGQQVKKGDVLLRLETVDLEQALAQGLASLETRKLELLEERARRDRALENWKRLGKDGDAPELLSRRPHVELKQAMLKAAQASVDLHKVNLRRAVMTAPFDGIITKRSVDPFETVTVGQEVLEILKTDMVEVRIPLTAKQLEWMEGFGSKNREKASEQKIVVEVWKEGRENITWEGEWMGLEPQAERTSRQVYGRVRMYGTYAKPAKTLRVGDFVELRCILPDIPEVFRVPRSSVFNGGDVWLMVEDEEKHRLKKHRLKVMSEERDRVWVSKDDWKSSWRLVTTPLGSVEEGTAVVEVDKKAKEQMGSSGASAKP